MYNFQQYAENKSELLTRMDVTKAKITELEEFGIDISESVNKIENAKAIVRDDKISVVLVGAFSDGKTSVAAGWLNEKMDNMKIDSDESSDEILCYTPNSIPEGCQIVDTPGLFGDKIGNDENGACIALSDKTKKFISEANIILYVVTAKNPIKDSHKECIKWILKDLNKLSTTVFVINRMDDVADMTDDDDYFMQARIKSENLRSKLSDCGLTSSEIQEVKIACISAAPDGKGIDVWRDNREEYLNRSHLSTLENITNTILQNSRQHLIVKTGCDVLNSEIKKNLEIIRENVNRIETIILPDQKETIRRNTKDLEMLRKRLMNSRREIQEELRTLEKRKIFAVRAATIENFKDVLEDEIGLLPNQEGYRLNEEINEIFERYCEKHCEWTGQLENSIQSEYDKQNEMMKTLLSKGTGVLKGAGNVGTEVFKRGIFAGRDLLGKVGKTIKFKPWQVVKMADFATKTLPVIGVGIDIVSDIISNSKEQKRNKEFERNKDKLKTDLAELFKGTRDSLNDDQKYLNDFAPSYGELSAQINEDKVAMQTLEKQLADFKAWEKKVVDTDFIFC